MRKNLLKLSTCFFAALVLGMSALAIRIQAKSSNKPIMPAQGATIKQGQHSLKTEAAGTQGERTDKQPEEQIPQAGPAICIRTAGDISGSMLNSAGGRNLYSKLFEVLSQTLGPQDQFSMMLFDDQRAFTTVAKTAWGPEASRALDGILHLRIKGGDRTFFSYLLEEISKSVKPADILLIVSDCLIDTGSNAEDAKEKDRAVRAALALKNAGVRTVLILPFERGANHSFEWLAAALQAKVITSDQLRAGALATHLISLRREQGQSVEAPGPATSTSTAPAHPLGAVIGIILVSGILLIAVLIIKRLKPALAVAPPAEPHYSLRVSWESPNDGFLEIPIEEAEAEISIGSNEQDAICRPGLVAGHVKVKVEPDALALLCYGPIRLADGTLLEPFNSQPAIEKFPLDDEIPFSAGESIFVAQRVSDAGGERYV